MKRVLAMSFALLLAGACRKPGPAVPPAVATSTAASAAPGAMAPAAKPMPAQLPEVLATVDGEKIERWEIENAVHGLEARGGTQALTDRRDQVLRGLLDQLVAFHVLAREARDRKLDASDVDVNVRLTAIKGGFPNDQAFQQALAIQGLTLEQLQRQTRMGLEIAKVVDAEITSKISVADQDVATFYQQNLERFKQGETVHASHILFAVAQGAEPLQKQQARARAQQALKRLRGGADFPTLAREQSQDPGSAPGGGDLGFVPKGATDPAFEAAAFALKPGGMSGIVETPFGFHIIKVLERRPAGTAALTEVSGQIKQFLIDHQRDVKLGAFVEQAKGKRKIQILV